MPLTQDILETINMIHEECLDIRTVTMGISLYDCQSDDPARLCTKVYDKIMTSARDLVPVAGEIEKKYGIPIINKRVSVTPAALLCGQLDHDGAVALAKTLDRAAAELGINFIGGFGALVQKGCSNGSRVLMEGRRWLALATAQSRRSITMNCTATAL